MVIKNTQRVFTPKEWYKKLQKEVVMNRSVNV